MNQDNSKRDRHISFDDAIRAMFSASGTTVRCTNDCPVCVKKRARYPNYPSLMFSSLGGLMQLSCLDAQGVEITYPYKEDSLTFNRDNNPEVLVSDLDNLMHLTTQDGHTVFVSLFWVSTLGVSDALKRPISLEQLCLDAGLPVYTPQG